MADELERTVGAFDEDLDDFDLDAEVDDDEVFGGSEDEEEAVPKSRVKKIIQKRLARERNKVKALYDQFKEVYGMSPEEVLEYGRREAAKYAQSLGAPGQQQVQNPFVGVNAPQAAAVNTAMAEAQGGEVQDPVMQKILELEARQREIEEARRMEREALEFIQKYPDVKLTDIPPEVLQRRAQGGVTLAEAYKLYIADKQIEEAAKRAAEETARNYKVKERARAEGSDFTGGGEAEGAGSLTEEERKFAQLYGLSPKQYAAYKAKLRQLRNEEE